MFIGKNRFTALALITALLSVAIWFIASQRAEVSGSGVVQGKRIIAVRRIDSEQYRHIIREVLGDTIVVEGRFADPIARQEGLIAVGAAEASVSGAGFTVAEEMARKVAAQVIAPAHRRELVGCQPATATIFDEACARQFIAATGRLLYRRALTDDELQNQLQSVAALAAEHNDFYAGLERSLINMLISPNFLFRIEYAESDPDNRGKFRLTALSKASRLSFLLWNSTPDDMLLEAAEQGELHTSKGLRRQVERMLHSARVENGVRGFFADMLAFDEFDTLSKDLSIYPKFTNEAMQDIGEQTLRTIVDHVINRDGDYRALFTTRQTFLTPALAALIGVPLIQALENAAPDRWRPYEFPAGDTRAGIIAQPGFVALHSHPGRTSPTLRGKALREIFLCQEVPAPPGNVDFTLVQDGSNPDYKTMRQRLTSHATVPTCAGCHKITDPIGLALETFDGAGSYRTAENGVPIDTSGEMDGVRYDDAAGLGAALSRNPNVVSCVVTRVYMYGVGRQVLADERKWLKDVRKDFAKSGHRLLKLFRLLSTSDRFYQVPKSDLDVESLALATHKPGELRGQRSSLATN